MITHRHHHVWRHYVEAWKDEGGLVHSSVNGKVIPPSNPVNLMVERHFYKLPRITPADAELLMAFVQMTGNKHLRVAHYNLIKTIVKISVADQVLETLQDASNEEKLLVQDLMINMEEKLHGQIEQNATYLLEELRQERADFMGDDEKAMSFFRFISHQYMRTKVTRDALGECIEDIFSETFSNQHFERLKNIMCHMAAENIGASLYADRHDFGISFFENKSKVGFITGGQPVVNLLGIGDELEHNEFVLYYPLSPSLSCVIAPKGYELCNSRISLDVVEELNDFIVWNSGQILIANSDSVLNHYLDRSSDTRPLSCRILASDIHSCTSN